MNQDNPKNLDIQGVGRVLDFEFRGHHDPLTRVFSFVMILKDTFDGGGVSVLFFLF